MATPAFITELRRRIGHDLLWLIGCSGVVLRGEGPDTEVLLVRRADDGRWTPVCGIVEPGERPDQTVVREAAEEAGVQVRVESLLRIDVGEPITYPNGDRCQYLDHDFWCRWLSGEPRVGDDESSEVGFFPVGDLPDLDPVNSRRVRTALRAAADPTSLRAAAHPTAWHGVVLGGEEPAAEDERPCGAGEGAR